MDKNLNLLINDELFSIVTSFYNDIYEDSEFVKISITPTFINHVKYAKNQFDLNPHIQEMSFGFPSKISILDSSFLKNMKNDALFNETINKVKSYAFLFDEELTQFNCQWDVVNSQNNPKLFLSISKNEENSLIFKISSSERMNSGTIKKHALSPKEDLLKVLKIL